MKPGLRLISALLLATLLMEQTAFANPDLRPVVWGTTEKPALGFTLPESVAVVEDAHLSSGKTVYLLQDAHTNESAQINLARTLELILKNDHDIRYVFTEAGIGDNSLSFVRAIAPKHALERAAKTYLKKGLLHGAEYLQLSTPADFVLWGVEDLALYKEALGSYKQVAAKREEFGVYLSKMDATIQSLKEKILNTVLFSFEKNVSASRDQKISFADYYEILLTHANIQDIPISAYPNLSKLKILKEKESLIDFTKANEEALRAVEDLPVGDREELRTLSGRSTQTPFKLGEEKREQKAYFAFLEEKVRDRGSYPNLIRYLEYLKFSKTLHLDDMLREQNILEQALIGKMTLSDDERILIRCQEVLRCLQKLLKFSLTPEEFEEYKALTRDFGMETLTGFLNRKVMETHTSVDKAIFLKDGLEDIVEISENFYSLTKSRDEFFVRALEEKMASENQSKAVLVTGGYHGPNLKSLLKARNISFYSITPQVFRETNIPKYENLLLNQTFVQGASKPGAEAGHLMLWALRQSGIQALDQNRLLQQFAAEAGIDRNSLAQPQPALGDGARLSKNSHLMPMKGLHVLREPRLIEGELTLRDIRTKLTDPKWVHENAWLRADGNGHHLNGVVTALATVPAGMDLTNSNLRKRFEWYLLTDRRQNQKNTFRVAVDQFLSLDHDWPRHAKFSIWRAGYVDNKGENPSAGTMLVVQYKSDPSLRFPRRAGAEVPLRESELVGARLGAKKKPAKPLETFEMAETPFEIKGALFTLRLQSSGAVRIREIRVNMQSGFFSVSDLPKGKTADWQLYKGQDAIKKIKEALSDRKDFRHAIRDRYAAFNGRTRLSNEVLEKIFQTSLSFQEITEQRGPLAAGLGARLSSGLAFTSWVQPVIQLGRFALAFLIAPVLNGYHFIGAKASLSGGLSPLPADSMVIPDRLLVTLGSWKEDNTNTLWSIAKNVLTNTLDHAPSNAEINSFVDQIVSATNQAAGASSTDAIHHITRNMAHIGDQLVIPTSFDLSGHSVTIGSDLIQRVSGAIPLPSIPTPAPVMELLPTGFLDLLYSLGNDPWFLFGGLLAILGIGSAVWAYRNSSLLRSWKDAAANRIHDLGAALHIIQTPKAVISETRVGSGVSENRLLDLRIQPAPGQKARVGVIGDIQGNFAKTLEAARAAGFVNARGNWSAGSDILILDGDLFDAGGEESELYKWIRKIEAQAIRAGGRVVSIYADHEELVDRALSGDAAGWADWINNHGLTTLGSFLGRTIAYAPVETMSFRMTAYLDELDAKHPGLRQGLRQWIAGFPYSVRVNERLLIVHGAPDTSASRFEEMGREEGEIDDTDASRPGVIAKPGKKALFWGRWWEDESASEWMTKLGLDFLVAAHTVRDTLKMENGNSQGRVSEMRPGLININVTPRKALPEGAQAVTVFSINDQKMIDPSPTVYYGPNNFGLTSGPPAANSGARLAEIRRKLPLPAEVRQKLELSIPVFYDMLGAGVAVMRTYRARPEIQVDRKEGKLDLAGAVVTEADRDVQRQMIRIAESALPFRFRITAEESEGDLAEIIRRINEANADSDFEIIIDPIDGTIEFIDPEKRGFGTLLTVLYKGEPISAFFAAPEFYERGRGLLIEASELRPGVYQAQIDADGQFLETSRIEDLSTVYSQNDPFHFGRSFEEGDSVFKVHRPQVPAAMTFASILGFSKDVFIGYANRNSNVWDVVAGLYFVEKAGGFSKTLSGLDIFPLRAESRQDEKIIDLVTGRTSAVEAYLTHGARLTAYKQLIHDYPQVFGKLEDSFRRLMADLTASAVLEFDQQMMAVARTAIGQFTDAEKNLSQRSDWNVDGLSLEELVAVYGDTLNRLIAEADRRKQLYRTREMRPWRAESKDVLDAIRKVKTLGSLSGLDAAEAKLALAMKAELERVIQKKEGTWYLDGETFNVKRDTNIPGPDLNVTNRGESTERPAKALTPYELGQLIGIIRGHLAEEISGKKAVAAGERVSSRAVLLAIFQAYRSTGKISFNRQEVAVLMNNSTHSYYQHLNHIQYLRFFERNENGRRGSYTLELSVRQILSSGLADDFVREVSAISPKARPYTYEGLIKKYASQLGQDGGARLSAEFHRAVFDPSKVFQPLNEEDLRRLTPSVKSNSARDFHRNHREQWFRDHPNGKLLTLVRHSESISNVGGMTQSHLIFSPLTFPRGQQQPYALARFHAREKIRYDRYVSSDLERPYKTLEPTARAAREDIQIFHRLREVPRLALSGGTHFKKFGDIHHFSYRLFSANPEGYRVPGYNGKRHTTAIRNLLKDSSGQFGPNHSDIAASHGLTIHLAVMTALGIDYSKYQAVREHLKNPANASLTILGYDPDQGGWEVLVSQDNSYLPKWLQTPTEWPFATALVRVYSDMQFLYRMFERKYFHRTRYAEISDFHPIAQPFLQPTLAQIRVNLNFYRGGNMRNIYLPGEEVTAEMVPQRRRRTRSNGNPEGARLASLNAFTEAGYRFWMHATNWGIPVAGAVLALLGTEILTDRFIVLVPLVVGGLIGVLVSLGVTKLLLAQSRAKLMVYRDPDIRKLVLRQSIERNEPGAFALLVGLLDDKDEDVRYMAIRMIGEMDPKRFSPTPRLILASLYIIVSNQKRLLKIKSPKFDARLLQGAEQALENLRSKGGRLAEAQTRRAALAVLAGGVLKAQDTGGRSISFSGKTFQVMDQNPDYLFATPRFNSGESFSEHSIIEIRLKGPNLPPNGSTFQTVLVSTSGDAARPDRTELPSSYSIDGREGVIRITVDEGIDAEKISLSARIQKAREVAAGLEIVSIHVLPKSGARLVSEDDELESDLRRAFERARRNMAISRARSKGISVMVRGDGQIGLFSLNGFDVERAIDVVMARIESEYSDGRRLLLELEPEDAVTESETIYLERKAGARLTELKDARIRNVQKAILEKRIFDEWPYEKTNTPLPPSGYFRHLAPEDGGHTNMDRVLRTFLDTQDGVQFLAAQRLKDLQPIDVSGNYVRGSFQSVLFAEGIDFDGKKVGRYAVMIADRSPLVSPDFESIGLRHLASDAVTKDEIENLRRFHDANPVWRDAPLADGFGRLGEGEGDLRRVYIMPFRNYWTLKSRLTADEGTGQLRRQYSIHKYLGGPTPSRLLRDEFNDSIERTHVANVVLDWIGTGGIRQGIGFVDDQFYYARKEDLALESLESLQDVSGPKLWRFSARGNSRVETRELLDYLLAPLESDETASPSEEFYHYYAGDSDDQSTRDQRVFAGVQRALDAANLSPEQRESFEETLWSNFLQDHSGNVEAAVSSLRQWSRFLKKLETWTLSLSETPSDVSERARNQSSFIDWFKELSSELGYLSEKTEMDYVRYYFQRGLQMEILRESGKEISISHPEIIKLADNMLKGVDTSLFDATTSIFPSRARWLIQRNLLFRNYFKRISAFSIYGLEADIEYQIARVKESLSHPTLLALAENRLRQLGAEVPAYEPLVPQIPAVVKDRQSPLLADLLMDWLQKDPESLVKWLTESASRAEEVYSMTTLMGLLNAAGQSEETVHPDDVERWYRSLDPVFDAEAWGGDALLAKGFFREQHMVLLEEIVHTLQSVFQMDEEKIRPLIQAFYGAPRHLFVPKFYMESSYENAPLLIGMGQTISQPSIVAIILGLLDLKKTDRVLELGGGSQWFSAVASPLAQSVDSWEIEPSLGRRGQKNIENTGITNVSVHIGDGAEAIRLGKKYEAIVVSAGAPALPQELAEVLEENGRLVIPVLRAEADHFGNLYDLKLYIKRGGQLTEAASLPVSFVKFRGSIGWDRQSGARLAFVKTKTGLLYMRSPNPYSRVIGNAIRKGAEGAGLDAAFQDEQFNRRLEQLLSRFFPMPNSIWYLGLNTSGYPVSLSRSRESKGFGQFEVKVQIDGTLTFGRYFRGVNALTEIERGRIRNLLSGARMAYEVRQLPVSDGTFMPVDAQWMPEPSSRLPELIWEPALYRQKSIGAHVELSYSLAGRGPAMARTALTVAETAQRVGIHNLADIRKTTVNGQQRVLERALNSYLPQEFHSNQRTIEDLLISTVYFGNEGIFLRNLQTAKTEHVNVQSSAVAFRSFYILGGLGHSLFPNGLNRPLTDEERRGFAERLGIETFSGAIEDILQIRLRSLNLDTATKNLLADEISKIQKIAETLPMPWEITGAEDSDPTGARLSEQAAAGQALTRETLLQSFNEPLRVPGKHGVDYEYLPGGLQGQGYTLSTAVYSADGSEKINFDETVSNPDSIEITLMVSREQRVRSENELQNEGLSEAQDRLQAYTDTLFRKMFQGYYISLFSDRMKGEIGFRATKWGAPVVRSAAGSRLAPKALQNGSMLVIPDLDLQLDLSSIPHTDAMVDRLIHDLGKYVGPAMGGIENLRRVERDKLKEYAIGAVAELFEQMNPASGTSQGEAAQFLEFITGLSRLLKDRIENAVFGSQGQSELAGIWMLAGRLLPTLSRALRDKDLEDIKNIVPVISDDELDTRMKELSEKYLGLIRRYLENAKQTAGFAEGDVEVFENPDSPWILYRSGDEDRGRYQFVRPAAETGSNPQEFRFSFSLKNGIIFLVSPVKIYPKEKGQGRASREEPVGSYWIRISSRSSGGYEDVIRNVEQRLNSLYEELAHLNRNTEWIEKMKDEISGLKTHLLERVIAEEFLTGNKKKLHTAKELGLDTPQNLVRSVEEYNFILSGLLFGGDIASAATSKLAFFSIPEELSGARMAESNTVPPIALEAEAILDRYQGKKGSLQVTDMFTIKKFIRGLLANKDLLGHLNRESPGIEKFLRYILNLQNPPLFLRQFDSIKAVYLAQKTIQFFMPKVIASESSLSASRVRGFARFVRDQVDSLGRDKAVSDTYFKIILIQKRQTMNIKDKTMRYSGAEIEALLEVIKNDHLLDDVAFQSLAEHLRADINPQGETAEINASAEAGLRSHVEHFFPDASAEERSRFALDLVGVLRRMNRWDLVYRQTNEPWIRIMQTMGGDFAPLGDVDSRALSKKLMTRDQVKAFQAIREYLQSIGITGGVLRSRFSGADLSTALYITNADELHFYDALRFDSGEDISAVQWLESSYKLEKTNSGFQSSFFMNALGHAYPAILWELSGIGATLLSVVPESEEGVYRIRFRWSVDGIQPEKERTLVYHQREFKNGEDFEGVLAADDRFYLHKAALGFELPVSVSLPPVVLSFSDADYPGYQKIKVADLPGMAELMAGNPEEVNSYVDWRGAVVLVREDVIAARSSELESTGGRLSETAARAQKVVEIQRRVFLKTIEGNFLDETSPTDAIHEMVGYVNTQVTLMADQKRGEKIWVHVALSDADDPQAKVQMGAEPLVIAENQSGAEARVLLDRVMRERLAGWTPHEYRIRDISKNNHSALMVTILVKRNQQPGAGSGNVVEMRPRLSRGDTGPLGARLSDSLADGARIASDTHAGQTDQEVTFIAHVYSETRQTGRLAIGDSVFEVAEEKNELVIYGYGKELLRTSRYQKTEIEDGYSEIRLSMSDVQAVLKNAFAASEQAEISSALDLIRAVGVIDLEALNPSAQGFDEVVIPLLAEELKLAHERSWGQNARFLLRGPDELKQRVAAQFQGLDFVVTDEKDLGDYAAARRVVLTSPGRPAVEGLRHFFIQTPESGDIPNFRGALRASLSLARVDELTADDERFGEVRNFVGLLGLKIEDVKEFIQVIEDPASMDALRIQNFYALPKIIRLPLSQIIQGARMALKMTEQAA